MTLKPMIEEPDSRAGTLFNYVIQILIVASLIAFSLETLPDLPSGVRRALERFEIVTVILFTAEYLLRLTYAKAKLRFVFSFFGLIDLLAILPFYLSTGIDLRSVRIFRLFRLFRILKSMRYSKATRRFKLAFLDVREELVLFLVATLFVLYTAAMGIYYFENEAQPDKFRSIIDCLWWAVATLTTVGYGDVYPITFGGRLFTFVILMAGLGVIALPSGLFASALTKTRQSEALAKTKEYSESGGGP